MSNALLFIIDYRNLDKDIDFFICCYFFSGIPQITCLYLVLFQSFYVNKVRVQQRI